MAQFIFLGTTSELLPGQMKVVRTPSGKRLLVNVDGGYHALGTQCTHQGCDLVEGTLNGATLTCPCHFAAFNVATGRVERGPAEDPLPTYTVHVDGNGVWLEA
jgi:nitrite reductase/ring-hydroxylating ferredoxin subunit